MHLFVLSQSEVLDETCPLQLAILHKKNEVATRLVSWGNVAAVFVWYVVWYLASVTAMGLWMCVCVLVCGLPVDPMNGRSCCNSGQRYPM